LSKRLTRLSLRWFHGRRSILKMSKKENKINALFIEQSAWLSRLAGREMSMDKESQLPRKPKEPQPAMRPSHEKVAENIEKWANSPGLQPPK
jgi:hypothetical protein